MAEIRKLCMAAKALRGTGQSGVRRRLYWLAAIHAGFSSGQRWGDLVNLPVAAIHPDRTCTFTQHKTGRRITVRFSKMAMLLIHRHGQQTVIPQCYSQNHFCLTFNKLVKAAAISRGTFKWLRRSAGSYVELESGRGPELLGNTRAVFEASYKAERITKRPPPEPPEL